MISAGRGSAPAAKGTASGMFCVSSTAISSPQRARSSTSAFTSAFWPWLTTETAIRGGAIGVRLAPVAVFEALDVVLAEIAARLHLDDEERHLARVLEPVPGSDGDVGGLVLVQEQRVVAARDLGAARDHHPVLGALAMQLQRDRRAGLHHQAFHLIALARVDRLVVAPRTVDAPVAQVLGAVGALQVLDHLAHVLAARAVGDEQRV